MEANLMNGVKIFADDPDYCPFCQRNVSPKLLWKSSGVLDIEMVESIGFLSAWQCTNKNCKRVFIVEYKLVEGLTYEVNRFLDSNIVFPEWPIPIQNLKDGISEAESETKFIKTYNQSLEAELYGLDEIAGMGFRKSLEYLVKDLAIEKYANKKDEILGKFLGNVINDYFDGEFKTLLVKTNWLGNDQAHYLKEYEEFDTETIKELIDFIAAELDKNYKKEILLESIDKRKLGDSLKKNNEEEQNNNKSKNN